MTTLLSQPITTAVTAQVGPAFKFPYGRAHSLTASFVFAGTGGTSADAYLQTSYDGGETWADIANFHTTAAATKLINLSSLTPVTTQVTPTDGSLAANTAVDGIIGDQLRVKYTSVGTWVAGNLEVNVSTDVRMAPV